MKKNVLFLLFYFSIISYSSGQTLYGPAFYGGASGGGTISKFEINSNSVYVAAQLDNFSAYPFYTSLVQAADGKMYGMTSQGGAGNGTIFSYDPATLKYLVLKNFNNDDGAFPSGSLLLAADGLLYGMTTFGGASNCGIIFSFNITTNTFTRLYDFDNSSGCNPSGTLIQAADGKLYGMANGGINGFGVIFCFDPVASAFNKLYEFDNVNGASPQGSLLLAADGNLYGTTVNGGTDGNGVLFSFNYNNSSLQKIKDFTNADGGYPYGNLLQASDGNLYGMAFGGGGTYGFVFSENITASAFTIVKRFDQSSGGNPYGSLIQANDGKLYGLTSDGGSNNLGSLFSIDPASLFFNKLKDFDNTSGAVAYGSLLQASDGKLYGLTFQGGIGNTGVIFSFDPVNDLYNKLDDLGANATGRNISAAFLKASDNKLYGLASQGGKNNDGVIFSYDPATLLYNKLFDMDSANGSNPFGSLIQATNGKLYGMTSQGGASNDGVIFSFDPATQEYTKLKDFTDSDGAHPYGSLLQASDGKLYGLTSAGGRYNYGTGFYYNITTGNFRKKDFQYIDGAYPFGSLIQANDGKLYGMTSDGGNGWHTDRKLEGAGVIFSVDLATYTYTKLKDFDHDNDGAYGTGSLFQATDGKLYGMNTLAGEANDGTLFSYDIASDSFNILNTFNGFNGAMPYGNITQASDGKLYGTTSAGGTMGNGVIFSYDMSNASFNKLYEYQIADGYHSYYGNAFTEVTESGPLRMSLISFTGSLNADANTVSWSVTNEFNAGHYELQRSTDGHNFVDIYQVAGIHSIAYSFDDHINTSVASVYYYRLKCIDVHGKFTFSNVIKVTRSVADYKIKIFPNPFLKQVTININSPVNDNAVFLITDNNGRLLYKSSKRMIPGNNIIVINEVSRFTSGTYTLSVNTSKATKTIKIIKGN